MALIAAEPHAQLNTAQAQDVFSKAEEHELLFQAVDLGVTAPAVTGLRLTCSVPRPLEVGIDIGRYRAFPSETCRRHAPTTSNVLAELAAAANAVRP